MTDQPKITELFKIINAHSQSFQKHDTGTVKFVSNGTFNNGVIGFVDPLEGERVFEEDAICVSSFCEATVQTAPFLPRGNGGSGLVVLLPRKAMSMEELYHYAAQINIYSWRFSFGRMVIGSRIADLKLRQYTSDSSRPKVEDAVAKLLPMRSKKTELKLIKIKSFPITKLCSIERKYSLYLNQVNTSVERTPYVTTTELNNGISLTCNEDPCFNKGTVSVSLDGICGTSFYQFVDYIAGEKTGVLSLLDEKQDKSLLFFIAAMIRLKAWRYHYGRKLSMGRLRDMEVPLPINEKDEIDMVFIKNSLQNCYGWDIVSPKL